MIRGEIYKDDQFFARFDATRWFEHKSDDEIVDVIVEGCSPPATDELAHYMSNFATGIKDAGVEKGKPLSEKRIECHISRQDAIAWIHRNKPSLLPRIK